MDKIDSNSPQGIYTFLTESDLKYEVEISKNSKTLKRIPAENNINKLRMDGLKIRIIQEFYIEAGKRAFFALEPLGKGNVTFRVTSIVKSIKYSEPKQFKK